MAIHKVKPNQNIWDVSVQLYGTIEGVFDLLISNPQINMLTELSPGMELKYHDFFKLNESIISGLAKDNLVPANGDRHVYYKGTDKPLIFIISVLPNLEYIDFSVSGKGNMLIDWGDNTDLESIELSDISNRLQHYFDNTVDARKVKIYGNFDILSLDTTLMNGDLYTIRPITVNEFISRTNDHSLKGLFLFENTVKVDLQGMTITDLSPIYDMSLQELNLRNVNFDSVSVLDEYLTYIVNNYRMRQSCKVYLSERPSEIGMEAIETILNKPEWNTDGQWEFIFDYLEVEPEEIWLDSTSESKGEFRVRSNVDWIIEITNKE